VSSSDYRLNQMVEIFERCLAETEIFRRHVPNKALFDWTQSEEKDGSRWALIAAGISEEAAERRFKPGSPAARDATIPLRVGGRGQAEILLQMRPVEWPSSHPKAAAFLAHYAPHEKIPWIEIAKGRISLDFDDPDGRLGLFNLRWEVDPREAGRPPKPEEPWLRPWWQTIGNINPAHPSSHLHFNSQPKAPGGERSAGWDEPPENDLRLAIGDPNPLAFVLSVATWVRRNLEVK
jgi:hypothetical protein